MAKARKDSALRRLQTSCNLYLHNCDKCPAKAVWTTVDHIIPVSFLVAVGLQEAIQDDADNLQKLCKACQNLKANKFDFRNPKTMRLLRKYVKRTEELYGDIQSDL